MATTTTQPTEVDPSGEALSMFYLRAENEDGYDLDLAVVAETQAAAVDLWGQHYLDGNEPVAEQWATSGKGVMTLAMPGDLDQHDLQPGAINWTLEPFRYPTS